MTFKELFAGGVVVTTLIGAAGCGEENKSTVATNLNQPLPPPPVGSGGGKAGKAGKAGSQQGQGQKTSGPTGTIE